MDEKGKSNTQKKRKLSLNKRLALISLSVLLPMAILTGYLIYILNSTNHAFDEVAESVTYANSFVMEFRERMDYSVYLAVIRGQHMDELESGKETINGIRVVNPYEYIEEVQNACDVMADIATGNINKNRPQRLKKTLDTLRKRVEEIDENIDKPGSYSTNMRLLDENIRDLTVIIEAGMRDFVNKENANFSVVKEEMIERGNQATRIAFISVIVVAVIAAVLSSLASRSVTRPIQQLCDMVKQVAKGDFTARTDEIDSEDEISVLTDSFNDMTAEIGQLVEGIKTEKDNLRVTESKLLQAQINPHFLYNTLDTIVWLAEEKKTEDVVSMVSWLSDFFRTTLSKGHDSITVEEERIHIDSYLKIQQFRYQDIMDYDIVFDEEIYTYMIPKLMLQPLVENALYHGIKMKRGKGRISIRGYRKGNRLIFKVNDNGKGMTERQLNELRRRIAGLEESGEGGFGLSNVNQRIQYYYGEEYGVFFESTEGEGTEATIILEAKNIIT